MRTHKNEGELGVGLGTNAAEEGNQEDDRTENNDG